VSVGRSVCLSRKCTVAKRLTGSGCVWGGEWGRWSDGCIRLGCVVIVEGKGHFWGVNVGRPIVSSGDFVA